MLQNYILEVGFQTWRISGKGRESVWVLNPQSTVEKNMYILIYIYALTVSLFWGVVDNTKKTTKTMGFYSFLLAMMRDPAEFRHHCCFVLSLRNFIQWKGIPSPLVPSLLRHAENTLALFLWCYCLQIRIFQKNTWPSKRCRHKNILTPAQQVVSYDTTVISPDGRVVS